MCCVAPAEANGYLAPPSPSRTTIKEDEEADQQEDTPTSGANDEVTVALTLANEGQGQGVDEVEGHKEERRTDSPVPAIAVTHHDRVVGPLLLS